MDTSQENLADPFLEEIHKAKENTEFMSFARIYRVPKELRELNGSAYTPRFVSIGPLHKKDKHLNPHMQKIKMIYLESLLYKTSKGVKKDVKDMLDKCLKEMRVLIPKAKLYYAEEVELDDKMLVTDGCFILEVLRRDYEIEETTNSSRQGTTDGCCFIVLEALRRTCDPEKTPDADSPVTEEDQSIIDPIFDIPLTCEAVLNDLLLVENQLPFFVLEKLFDCTLGRTSNPPPPNLRACVARVFGRRLGIGDECTNSNATNCGGRPGDCVLSLGEGNNNNNNPTPKSSDKGDCPNTYHHILHLLSNHYLGDPPLQSQGQGKKSRPSKESKDMPSASDLAYKGVKFESCKNPSEVDFQILGPCRGACFRIPTLCVHDSTEPILRNLIALEQCIPRSQLYFTSYACLMDRLVNTKKDVEELVGAGLIHNFLGNSKEASRFLNNLCKGITLDPKKDIYSDICNNAANYSEGPWYNRVIPATMTHLKCKFRASPWTCIAFFIAFVSFGISLTNFIRSFLG